MPCVSGVPETIHLDVVCKAAQVLATAVFGDDTICISSRTTRVQRIWAKGFTSPRPAYGPTACIVL